MNELRDQFARRAQVNRDGNEGQDAPSTVKESRVRTLNDVPQVSESRDQTDDGLVVASNHLG